MKDNGDDAPLCGLTDSHFHSLAMRSKGIDPLATVEACKAEGMAEMLDIGLDPADLESRLGLLGEIEGVYFTSGISPAHAADDDWKEQLQILEKQVGEGKIVAIGELGLDWYRNYGSRESQMALVRTQLAIAKTAGLPVIMHNREADLEILDLMKEANLPAGGVLHCFSSNYEMAVKCIELGYMISFSGNLTYKNAGQLQDAAARIPLGSLLLETDAPYLSPQAVRGSVNTPRSIIHIYKLAASIRGVTVRDLTAAVRTNLCRFLNLEPAVNRRE